MFYNVTFHRMSHFGSSKHSSILWGFALFLKKKQSKKNNTCFLWHTRCCTSVAGSGKKKQRECFFFSSYPSRSVLFSCFSIVHFQFAFLGGTANPTSSLWAMDVAELQRQISRLSLEDLIQVAIHLIFEIEYRLELQRTRDQDISDSDIADSDDDLWFEFFLSLDDEPWQRWWLAAHWWRVGTLGFGFNHCRYIRAFLASSFKIQSTTSVEKWYVIQLVAISTIAHSCPASETG